MWILCFPVSGTQMQWSSKWLARQSQLSDQGVPQFGHWWCMDIFKCLCVTLRNYSWIWNPNIPINPKYPNLKLWTSSMACGTAGSTVTILPWWSPNFPMDRPQTDHWTIGIHGDHLRFSALASPRACPKSTWQGFPGPGPIPAKLAGVAGNGKYLLDSFLVLLDGPIPFLSAANISKSYAMPQCWKNLESGRYQKTIRSHPRSIYDTSRNSSRDEVAGHHPAVRRLWCSLETAVAPGVHRSPT